MIEPAAIVKNFRLFILKTLIVLDLLLDKGRQLKMGKHCRFYGDFEWVAGIGLGLHAVRAF